MVRELLITNRRGLHARAAARFVKVTEQFDAAVEVFKDGETVSGVSILGLMMLAASPGTTISVSADGPDAVAVLDALSTLVTNRFDEE
jgi:phosphocarrier protein